MNKKFFYFKYIFYELVRSTVVIFLVWKVRIFLYICLVLINMMGIEDVYINDKVVLILLLMVLNFERKMLFMIYFFFVCINVCNLCLNCKIWFTLLFSISVLFINSVKLGRFIFKSFVSVCINGLLFCMCFVVFIMMILIFCRVVCWIVCWAIIDGFFL